MSKLDLSSISLVALGSTKIVETLSAIDICLKYANFKEVIFFSDKPNPYQCNIQEMKSIKDYDKFVVYELPNQKTKGDFILTIHWDCFIVNPKAWTDDFYNYDYIGAPWPWLENMVGNGGFCLKSKKFLHTQKQIVSNIDNIEDPDDLLLSYRLRSQFIEYGCKYGDEIGYQFSTEYGHYPNYNSFGFHDFNPNPQFRPLIYQ